MKAVFYTRVSTEEQTKGYSLDSQREKCLKYIEFQEWTLHDEYQEDGYSAKNLNRPESKRLIRDIQSKKFDFLVVLSLDRLTRSVKDLYYLLDLFQDHGIGFKSITENFDTTTPSGRLHINQLAAFAEWERENISDRMMRGKEQKAKQGGIVGAPLPYGYQYNDKKNIVIDPSEAAVVKRLFTEYQQKGMFSLAKIFNKEKIPSPSKTRWSMPGIKHILENPFYIGEIHFNRKKDESIVSLGKHEPIVSKELFGQTQEIMSKRVNNQGASTSSYPFSGILKCGRCGGAMTGTKFSRLTKSGERKTYYFYHCNSRRLGVCDMPQVSENKIEKLFFSYNWSIKNKDFTIPNEQENTDEAIDDIKTQLSKVQATKKRWQLAFGEGVIDLDEFRELSKMSKDQEQKLNKKLESLLSEKHQTPIYDIASFQEQIEHIKGFWCKMGRGEKHEFISTIVNRIVIEVYGDPIGNEGRRCRIVDFQLN